MIVVGAGPTGLTLATALAVRGIQVAVVDRAAAGANTSRAAVVHARTLEVLAGLEVTPRLIERGVIATRFTIRDRDRVLVPLRFEDLPTRYPYTLLIPQAATERVLHERFAELGGEVRWERAVRDVRQTSQHVSAVLDDGTQLCARYLVGADGMHSTIRERLGVGFRGGRYHESFSLADVHLAGGGPRDEIILYFSPAGLLVLAPLPDGLHRIVATVDSAPEQPELDYLQALLDARGPEREKLQIGSVIWGSRFRVHHRLADSYRVGRVALAGDAAHVHSPAGGQGMNTGIQDAVALAEALEDALQEGDPEQLKHYETLRRPVAKNVLKLAGRLTTLANVGRPLRPVRNAWLHGLARLPTFRRSLALRLAGLADVQTDQSLGQPTTLQRANR